MTDAEYPCFAIRSTRTDTPPAAMLTFSTHAQTEPMDYTELIHKQGVVPLAQPQPQPTTPARFGIVCKFYEYEALVDMFRTLFNGSSRRGFIPVIFC